MRSRRIACVTAAALMAALAVVPPASAAVTGTTTMVLAVEGGVLAITVPVGTLAVPVDLGTRVNTVGGGVLSGSLGVVQVSDARSAIAGSGWLTTAISTAFTPAAGPAIPAANIGYTAGVITKVGTATYVANDPAAGTGAGLTGVSPVVTASGITGDNSATWNPTINVTIPGAMASTTYVATITHSLT